MLVCLFWDALVVAKRVIRNQRDDVASAYRKAPDSDPDLVSRDLDSAPLKCHADDDLQLYLSTVNSLPPARMYDCDYDYAPHSYMSHHFVSFGQEAINCVDLPALSNTTAERWHSSGCTPFRHVAATAARIQSCVRRAAFNEGYMPEFADVMQRAAKYYWKPSSKEASAKVRAYLKRKAEDTLKEFDKEMTEEWWLENAAEGAERIAKCFEEESAVEEEILPNALQPDVQPKEHQLTPIQHAMRCLPSLWGRVGFGVGGLRNEGVVYRSEDGEAHAESWRFNCQKAPDAKGHKDKCTEKCAKAAAPRPLACSRLSVASLAHFTPKRYEQNLPVVRWAAQAAWRKLGGKAGIEWCRKKDDKSAANCLLFTQCAEAELDNVCDMVPECCGEKGLQPVPEEEQQVVVTLQGDTAETGAAWAVGAEEAARQQRLFPKYGCTEDCAGF